MAVTVADNCPTLTVEIDFVDDASDSPTNWTDVSTYVRSLTCQRSGRNSELARIEPGTLAAVLSNRDARFDPTNTGGAYYPNVRRMRWIRVSATWSSTTYIRWQGLIDEWELDWPAGGHDAIVTITATDALKAVNLFDIGVGFSGPGYPAQLAGERIDEVLFDAEFADRNIATGKITVVPSGSFAPGSSLLAHINECAETDGGIFFAEPDGTLVYQGSDWRRTNANSLTSRATIGDTSGDAIWYREAQMSYGDEYLYNHVSVTPAAGAEQTWTNDDSITRYFRRGLSKQILSASETDALNMAQALVQRYADPWVRIPTLTLLGRAKTSSWPTILSAILSERFTWKRTATGHTIQTDGYVERIKDEVKVGSNWLVSFDLSPVDDTAVWLAGSAQHSQAGQTTVAAA